MRFLLLLILTAACSSPLKYKHSFSKEYLSSLTDEDIRVVKIQISLKEEKLFASGMDSTFIHVKLFDNKGNQLITVDPMDLVLSSSEDLEAKPFAIKQGIYKAEILPRPKSPKIKLQVDWQEKVMSEILTLHTTTHPLKVSLKPVTNEFPESRTHGEVIVTRTTASAATEGFSFTNVGDNKIVSKANSSRTYSFDYPEQAKQNVALEVDDAPNDTVSQTMHSYFMFFPRKQLPVVEQLSGTLDVTLPTGEKISFQKESKEIVGGVLKEGPLDNSNDRFKRSFASLKYEGKGVMIRTNARGQSPQIAATDTTKIDLENGSKGSQEVLIVNGSTGQKCRRPKSEFWEPLDVRPIEFKYPNDEALDVHLKSVCGFGLPKI